MKNELIGMQLLFALGVSGIAEADELEEDLLSGVVEPTAMADSTPPRVLAAEGPGEDRRSISIGMALLGAVPTVDLRYVQMFGARLGVDAAASTIVVLERARVSMRYVLLDTEDGALAIRAGFMEAHSAADSWLNLGAGPGVLYSVGSNDARFTIALDLAWPFLDSSGGNRLGGAMQLQPAIGVELPIADDMELFLEASALSGIQSGALEVLPIFSAGLGW